MLETNLRIVHPGPALYVWTRRAVVTGPDLTPDLLQRACHALRARQGLAAVPAPADDPPSLLVATDGPVRPLTLAGEEWEIDVADAGEPARRLTLDDRDGPDLLAQLIERALLARLGRRADLWTLDSPRIFYEAAPFRTQQGIAAYRRYEIAALPVAGVGIGVAIDLGTAFFTHENLVGTLWTADETADSGLRVRPFRALTSRAYRFGPLLVPADADRFAEVHKVP